LISEGLPDTQRQTQSHAHASLHDESGFLYYRGGLNLGRYHGTGISYDPATKNVLYQGKYSDQSQNDPAAILYYNNKNNSVRYIGGVTNGSRDGNGELVTFFSLKRFSIMKTAN
jgi:hypothetical protein